MSTTFGMSHERHNPGLCSHFSGRSRGGFMGSMEPPLDLPPSKILCTNVPYVDNQLLCSLCGLKRSHTCGLQGLAVSCPIFAISPQEYTRNDLRRSVILGGLPPDHPSRHAMHTPPFKILDPALHLCIEAWKTQSNPGELVFMANSVYSWLRSIFIAVILSNPQLLGSLSCL